MEKICKTCKHWQVTGSGEYGHAMFPGSWGTERRDNEDRMCKCRRFKDHVGEYYNLLSSSTCPKWEQASDIIDECEECGALLYEYKRPATPGSDREHYNSRLGVVRFWHSNDDMCEEHYGVNYHGDNPFECGMCQGAGTDIYGNRCDACHGSGEADL